MSRNNSGCAYTWGGRGEGERKLSHFVFCVCRDSPSRLLVSPPIPCWIVGEAPLSLSSVSLSFLSVFPFFATCDAYGTHNWRREWRGGGRRRGEVFSLIIAQDTTTLDPYAVASSTDKFCSYMHVPVRMHVIRSRPGNSILVLFLSPVHSLAHISDRVRNKKTCFISSLPLSSS